jgi:branched-chain amino acid transport system substrate-binding protein
MKKVEKVLVFSCMLSMLVMFCLSLPFAHEAAAQTKILKIGLISSVTGPMAPAFKSELDAAKPAEDLLNQKGGITVQGQKYRIEITTADDQSSPPGAVSAANKLLQDGIKFVIAPMFMPSNMAIAPTCEEAKVLRVTPNCVDPSPFGPPNHYSFNAQETIYNIPYVYGELAKLYPRVKRVAVIYPDDPGAKLPTEMTVKEIKKRGMEVVFNEAYRIPTEDFYPLLTKALAQKPDAIECEFAIIPWAKGLINQSREMGFSGPINAMASFGDTGQLKAVVEPKYAYDICHATPDVTSPKMTAIVKEYGKLVEKETGDKFNFDHVLTLQAAWIIVQGVEKAQSFDTDKVTAALESMSSINTPYGKGRFGGQDLVGQNRLMISNIPFSRFVKGGKVEFEFLPVK